jgi:hypothetical protein
MTKRILFLLFGLHVLVVGFSQVEVTTDPGWPRQLTQDGAVLTLYQPQVDDWQQYKNLDCRMAFALLPYQGKKVVGVLYLDAQTNVNMDNRMVEVYNMVVTQTHFPSLDDPTAEELGQLVRSFITSSKIVVISLDRIVACTQKQAPTSTVHVNNQPPVIYVSNAPSILLQLEGKPQLYKTSDASLQFIFNANWPLFFSKTNAEYYLFDDQEWQKASQLAGPWTFTSTLPQALVSLGTDPQWTNLKTAIPAPARSTSPVPGVFYSENPAEIILFGGQPIFQPIAGTNLKYATNTASDLFFSSLTSEYYYLTAGRWFASATIQGPWTYATPALPADFQQIPATSEPGRVLSSVPGTPEAEDAVMIAQIPTQIQVNATQAAAQVKVTYSGAPQFESIEGTSLSYVVNSPQKIVMVSPTQYYLCFQGIWFWSANPQGPWQTATLVPQVIYTIPPSSPYYNVTFVTQTVTSTGYVEASYTSGYMGSYVVVAGGGVIVASGTGYYSPPFFYYPPVGYPVCFVAPMTYGAYAYHPYYGATAYHASYNPYSGTYARSATAYEPYGKATGAQAYNPHTGTYASGASVSNAYGTHSAAQAYNPYTGASATTHQQSNAYGQSGSTTATNKYGQSATSAHASNANGSVGGVATSSGGKAVGATGAGGNSYAAAKSSSGDMYASKDGNVYSNSNGSWQKQDNGSSSSSLKPNPSTTSAEANHPSASRNASAAQSSHPSSTAPSKASGSGAGSSADDFNKEAQNRQRGATQSQRFGGGGGGGFSRGGGGGGGGGFGGFRR